VVERASLDLKGCTGFLRTQRVGLQFVEKARARVKHAYVRAVKLVRRTDQKVGIEGSNVKRMMRRVMNRVEDEVCSGGA